MACVSLSSPSGKRLYVSTSFPRRRESRLNPDATVDLALDSAPLRGRLRGNDGLG